MKGTILGSTIFGNSETLNPKVPLIFGNSHIIKSIFGFSNLQWALKDYQHLLFCKIIIP